MRALMNIEEGFNFIFSVKFDLHQVLTNCQFLGGGHDFLFIINLHLIVHLFSVTNWLFSHSIVLIFSSSHSICNNSFSHQFFISTTEIVSFHITCSAPSTKCKNYNFGKTLQKLNALSCNHPRISLTPKGLSRTFGGWSIIGLYVTKV